VAEKIVVKVRYAAGTSSNAGPNRELRVRNILNAQRRYCESSLNSVRSKAAGGQWILLSSDKLIVKTPQKPVAEIGTSDGPSEREVLGSQADLPNLPGDRGSPERPKWESFG